jgi:hypothetical protein
MQVALYSGVSRTGMATEIELSEKSVWSSNKIPILSVGSEPFAAGNGLRSLKPLCCRRHCSTPSNQRGIRFNSFMIATT